MPIIQQKRAPLFFTIYVLVPIDEGVNLCKHTQCYESDPVALTLSINNNYLIIANILLILS